MYAIFIVSMVFLRSLHKGSRPFLSVFASALIVFEGSSSEYAFQTRNHRESAERKGFRVLKGCWFSFSLRMKFDPLTPDWHPQMKGSYSGEAGLTKNCSHCNFQSLSKENLASLLKILVDIVQMETNSGG